jgi:hypothetical protein
MLPVRVLGLLTAIALGALVLLYMASGNRRYLSLAWATFRYALFVVILVMLLFVFERLLVAV